ncbi:hypothetical protein MXG51_004540 [Salmonella enterica]|nr:hypothetical protein [Salmonella enterica]
MRRLSSPGNITEWKTSFCAMRALGDHDRKNDLRGNSCFQGRYPSKGSAALLPDKRSGQDGLFRLTQIVRRFDHVR